MLWLIVLILVAAVVLAVVLDRPIPTPIPKSILELLRDVTNGSWLLTLWRLALVLALFALSFAMVAAGGVVLPFIAAVVLTFLISDTVQAVVRDLWDLRFVRVDP